MSEHDSTATVSIPGTFTVEYHGDLYGGHIARMTFTPHAGEAGYFGPSAEVWDAATRDDGLDRLDVESTDGPFWAAMQAALTTTTRFASMDANADDSTVEGPAVPIEWTE